MTIATVILGATGYVGGELLRLVAAHPEFELHAAVSRSRNGERIAETFPHLSAAYPVERFTAPDDWHDGLAADAGLALFSAAPHGASGAAVEGVLRNAAERDLRVVDCSADFRYATAAAFEAVYGIPHPAPRLVELFACGVPEHVEGVPGKHVGHPGCFATAILLAAVPLLKSGLSDSEIFVSGITGSTGSGSAAKPGTHHPERHSNLYAYKPLEHRHAPEVAALIESATGVSADVRFVPHSGPFARGIYVTVQAKLKPGTRIEVVRMAYEAIYEHRGFVHVVDGPPRLKDVVASNYCNIGLAADGDTIVVMCAIDNLVKGAAGGAMQWMNRLWALPESTGLEVAAPAWT